MKFIPYNLAISHPFANGEYDHEHANEHFIIGCETYKEFIESLPIMEAEIPDYMIKDFKMGKPRICEMRKPDGTCWGTWGVNGAGECADELPSPMCKSLCEIYNIKAE